MFKSGRIARKEGAAASLRMMSAIGMRRDFAPHWPVPLPSKRPEHLEKHTLVLDIDETLIHTFAMTPHEVTPKESPVVQNVPLIDYHMFVRPNLREFLLEVSQLFEVVFWTAGVASYCAAVLDAIEQNVMGLPPSTYNYLEMLKSARDVDAPGTEKKAVASGTNHVNFYALSRTQTLESQGYMKFLPMLGRPLTNVIMVDDNVRSFPLNPRNGIKIAAFDPDDAVLQNYMEALTQLRGKGLTPDKAPPALKAQLEAGVKEMARLETDRALLDILPVLRAVAAVPMGDDVTRELDHWRDPEYVKCDDFRETMNRMTVARQRILGSVLPTRSPTPIPPLRMDILNRNFTAAAKLDAEMQQAWKPPRGSHAKL